MKYFITDLNHLDELSIFYYVHSPTNVALFKFSSVYVIYINVGLSNKLVAFLKVT
jgi:hypothetical protein